MMKINSMIGGTSFNVLSSFDANIQAEVMIGCVFYWLKMRNEWLQRWSLC